MHISNGVSTAKLVKRVYGIDSIVLYPPVPVEKLLGIDLDHGKHPWILVIRPTYEGRALPLSAIARRMLKNVKLVIMSRIDRTGQHVLQHLKKLEINFVCLGSVDEKTERTVS